MELSFQTHTQQIQEATEQGPHAQIIRSENYQRTVYQNCSLPPESQGQPARWHHVSLTLSPLVNWHPHQQRADQNSLKGTDVSMHSLACLQITCSDTRKESTSANLFPYQQREGNYSKIKPAKQRKNKQTNKPLALVCLLGVCLSPPPTKQWSGAPWNK